MHPARNVDIVLAVAMIMFAMNLDRELRLIVGYILVAMCGVALILGK